MAEFVRQKRSNALFTILYPGYYPGIGTPAKNSPSVAITNSGEFVSVCTEEGCAVFYSARDLRLMAAVLNEAADIFEANQAKAK